MKTMELLLLMIVIFLLIAVAGLIARLYLMKKAAKEIAAGFAEKISEETNTLIDISSCDSSMRALAADINRQLARLRSARTRYENGDRELKDAITGISHDLRTPLTAICGYLDLMETMDASDEMRRYLLQIRNRAEAMKQLTEELFRYSVAASQAAETQPASSFVSLDLRQALEENLLSFYGAMQSRRIQPQISLPTHRVIRTLPVADLDRIFNNIIANALKYSDGDLIVCMSDDGTVSFSNTAKSLDAVSAARLFDRYYTVQNNQNSTGLGLSIARLLTERLNGTIFSEYQNGRLTITVSFPAAPEH